MLVSEVGSGVQFVLHHSVMVVFVALLFDPGNTWLCERLCHGARRDHGPSEG